MFCLIESTKRNRRVKKEFKSTVEHPFLLAQSVRKSIDSAIG